MAVFQGEMTLTVNGAPVTLRGAITEMPDRFEKESIVNQDGSLSQTLKPAAYEMDATFEDRGENWDAIANGGPYTIGFVERQTGRQRVFSNAIFTGRASVSRENGEVSGLKIVASEYVRRGG